MSRWPLIALTITAALAVTSARASTTPLGAVVTGEAAAGHGTATTPVEADPRYYIVLLEGEPLLGHLAQTGELGEAYGSSPGSLASDASEADASGARSSGINEDNPEVAAYMARLESEQQAAIEAIEAVTGKPADVLFRYRYASNGLAVRLTAREARRVSALPGVLGLEPNTPRYVDTDAGPAWIGAPAVWDGSALGSDVGSLGEGVIVGVVDTGINMDHPSFAEVDERGYEHLNPRGEYLGMCNRRDPNYDRRLKCNDKLIGVYGFVRIDGKLNPEDDHGHGSHTASTAAGNFVTTDYRAPTIAIERTFSGVAPHANIIAYDACYNSGGRGVCPPVATLAALDQAAKDHVDVVNFSIATGRASPWVDAHSLAFKHLREAGVVAAVSAGNSGPGPATTAAIAPWVMAVGAATHDRQFVNALTDISGGGDDPPTEITGRGLTAGYGPAPIVYAGSGEYENEDGVTDDGGCLKPFKHGTFHGEIVVCDRGDIPRVQKGQNVLDGGAGGLVLANKKANGSSINGDAHVLPAVHITYDDAVALKGWLANGEGHTARITAGEARSVPETGDIMGSFSSRGPAVSSFCCRRPGVDIAVPQLFDVLKPDLMAPGVDVIAAWSSNAGLPKPEFFAAQGTSMSSPHVAGAGALLRSARPGWTPAEIQSALMSTAEHDAPLAAPGGRKATWFEQGAGRIDVGRAVRAGMLLDVSDEEMANADPAKGGDPRTLNLASLTDTECLAHCTWTRVVRSPLDKPVEWEAAGGSSSVPISVSPARFTLAPGEEQVLTIDVDVTGAARDKWVFADVVFDPSDSSVPSAHFPVTVYTVSSILPPFTVIQTNETVGESLLAGLKAGDVNGLVLGVHGLAKADDEVASLRQDPTPNDRYDIGSGRGNHVVLLEAEEGARRIVAEVTSSEAPDVDLFVGYDANGDGVPQQQEQLCTSLSEGWAEYCELSGQDLARAGTYWVLVQNYTGSRSQPDDIAVSTAVVQEGDAGNLSVSGPADVENGKPFDLQLSWDLPSLEVGDRWLGVVELGTADDPVSVGAIMVDVIGVEHPPTPTALPPTATAMPATATPTPTEPAFTPTPGSSPEPTGSTPRNAIFLPQALNREE